MPIITFAEAKKLTEPGAPDRSGKETVNNGSKQTTVNKTANQSNSQTIPPASSRKGASLRTSYAGGESRIPWIITSSQWVAEGKALAFHAGPTNVSWSMPLRAAEEPVSAGQARFSAPRRGGSTSVATYYDLPKVGFSWQAGNIMPVYDDTGEEVSVPNGLQDFYDFMELMNQPPFLGPGSSEGARNYIWLYYTSLKFPRLVLYGYMDVEGISFSDSVDSASTVEWTSSMTVFEMTPSIWESKQLQNNYIDYMKANVIFK